MPEGDTLARISTVLRPLLVGHAIVAAQSRPGGVQLQRVVGRTVLAVSNRGKHLLIDFDNGLTLHTHLGLHGSWLRYPRERFFQRSPSRVVAQLETAEWVVACMDAPTAELLDTRAVAIHPQLRSLGSDTSNEGFDIEDAMKRLRATQFEHMPVGDALLDQGAVAGFGNVYRSELPFLERISPFVPVKDVSDEKLRAMLDRGEKLVKLNSGGGARVTTTVGTPSDTYVYGRAGRPCLRCRTAIKSQVTKRTPQSPPRRVYWCPSCQPEIR